MGFARRVFSWQRWLGAALMVVGVVLVSHFPGDTVESVRQQQAKQAALAAAAASAAEGNSVHLDAAPAGPTLGNAAAATALGPSSSSNLGRRLAALELWHAKANAAAVDANAAVAAAPQRQQQRQRRFCDSASSAAVAGSWPSLAVQDLVERHADAYVHLQDRL